MAHFLAFGVFARKFRAAVYLKSIELHNTGPIESLKLDLPFAGDLPKPLVLVGRNGSGKSTVLSFIVNAILAFKQRLFDEGETETGRAYRLRSPLGIRHGANYFYSALIFERYVRCTEWQLDRPRHMFEVELGWTPTKNSWKEIGPYETSNFDLVPGSLATEQDAEEAYKANCLLFFPADRFEPADWLNQEDLSPDLHLPDHKMIKRRTVRRVISRNRLRLTVDWLMSLTFDKLLQRESQDPLTECVFEAVGRILREILAGQVADDISFYFGNRNNRVTSAELLRNGVPIAVVRDLLGLSAGESALFCLFASIIRDADQAQMEFSSVSDIRGIVLIDEADLHLHLDLQHRTLPRLLALFPRVQFILTAHAPLVVLGLEGVLGKDGFQIIEMPTGMEIDPETYSEFVQAFDVFSRTRTFRNELLCRIKAQAKPVLLLEGKSDEEIIKSAWAKCHPTDALPFEPIGVGNEKDAGGARNLNHVLRFGVRSFGKMVLALFDNDEEGAAQFNGLKSPEYVEHGFDEKRHKSLPVRVLLLPVPPGREKFAPVPLSHRILSIEHYFSDSILSAHGLKGPEIYPGLGLFKIEDSKKVEFAASVSTLSEKEFNNFEPLFQRLALMLVP